MAKPCVECGKGKQYSKQKCKSCYDKWWYACHKAPPAKPAPDGVDEEINSILDGYLRYEAATLPYRTPQTTECIQESDRLEIEIARKTGWEAMEAKARKQLEDSKNERAKRKEDRGRVSGYIERLRVVERSRDDDPADGEVPARKRIG